MIPIAKAMTKDLPTALLLAFATLSNLREYGTKLHPLRRRLGSEARLAHPHPLPKVVCISLESWKSILLNWYVVESMTAMDMGRVSRVPAPSHPIMPGT